MFGFFKAIGRGFKSVFWDVFKSQMAKFVARYEATFRQVILDVAEGAIEGNRDKQAEAYARITTALKGVPEAFRTHWIACELLPQFRSPHTRASLGSRCSIGLMFRTRRLQKR